MLKLPNDTVLSEAIRSQGELTLRLVFEALQTNTSVKIIIMIAAMIMLVASAIAIFRLKATKFVVSFWLGFLMLIPSPSSGFPLSYVALKYMGGVLSDIFGTVVNQIFVEHKKNEFGQASAVKSIIAALDVSNEIEKGYRKSIEAIATGCVPEGLKNDNGDYITAYDLLGAEVDLAMVNSPITFPFKEEYISERTVTYLGEKVLCKKLIQKTLIGIRSAIAKKVECSNENSSSCSKEILTHSINIAQQNVVKRNLYKTVHGKDNDNFGWGWFLGKNDESVEIGLQNSSFMTKAKYTFSNISHSFTRALGIDKTFKTADKFYEINQKMTDLPFLFSTMQMVINLIWPILCLLPFFNHRGITITAAFVWLGTIVAPWTLMLLRETTNMFFISMDAMENIAGTDEFLAEITRVQNVMLGVELGISTLIGGIIPVAGAYFVNKGSSRGAGIKSTAMKKSMTAKAQEAQSFAIRGTSKLGGMTAGIAGKGFTAAGTAAAAVPVVGPVLMGTGAALKGISAVENFVNKPKGFLSAFQNTVPSKDNQNKES